MNPKAVLAALLLTLASSAAIAAPFTLDKRYYKLTFADGWATNPFLPGDDTTAMVMKTYGEEQDGNAIVWTHGQIGGSAGTADEHVNGLTRIYTQGFIRTDSSTKTLGGKSFRTTGWRDTGSEAATGSRVRIYVCQQGDLLFASWLTYISPDGDSAVGEEEAALATLEIKATGIRRPGRFPRNPGLDPARARLDVLGRTWQPTTGHIPKGPFFLKR